MKKPWEQYPKLVHIANAQMREQLESRRRHRQVRYLLFRLKTEVDKGASPSKVRRLPSGFAGFWAKEEPEYMLRPMPGSTEMIRSEIPEKLKGLRVDQLGGYAAFASRWDVDADLVVYLRWSSIWQEWAATLMRVVPILGEA